MSGRRGLRGRGRRGSAKYRGGAREAGPQRGGTQWKRFERGDAGVTGPRGSAHRAEVPGSGPERDLGLEIENGALVGCRFQGRNRAGRCRGTERPGRGPGARASLAAPQGTLLAGVGSGEGERQGGVTPPPHTRGRKVCNWNAQWPSASLALGSTQIWVTARKWAQGRVSGACPGLSPSKGWPLQLGTEPGHMGSRSGMSAWSPLYGHWVSSRWWTPKSGQAGFFF